MPLIDVRCTAASCGAVHEAYRALADWPKTPPCQDCGSPTEQAFLPRAVSWSVDPVVVFQAPDGTYRFPGDANGKSVAHYAKLGYTRLEIRSAAEMRAFEREVNRRDASESARRQEGRQQQREAREAVSRAALRAHMGRFSRFGREVARAAMARNDQKPRERGRDPGFHSEIYANDRSNREESRGPNGRRRRD